MKKRHKKLSLNRETIRRLEQPQIERAQGGWTGPSECYTCIQTVCYVCPTDPPCLIEDPQP
ncbi:MAG: class I lanthipeptide [Acidobacteriota bacterium]